MKYCVRTRFYDDGKVKAEVFEVEADQKPQDSYAETNTCDIYYDYFDTSEEAQKYANDALLA